MSAKKRGKGGGKDGRDPPEHPKRKSRSSDLGRALRTVYDDTLRESVPDDFMDLLRKLT